MSDAAAARRFYAEEIRAVAAIESDALIEAFASVPREHFLGPGPWLVARPFDGVAQPDPPYRTTRDADPAHIHHNVLVAIDPARQLNNGLPSALAMWIDALALRAGEHVVHVGAGVGYYSAVMAEVVGASGRVTAIEVDAGLAAQAKQLLAPWPWVSVVHGDAASVPAADAIFVNAGCTRPREPWLGALASGGRLIVPFTTAIPNMPHGVGAMVLLARLASGWRASVVSRVGMYDCAIAREPADLPALATLLRGGGPIRSMRLDAHDASPTCVVHNATYCLSSQSI